MAMTARRMKLLRYRETSMTCRMGEMGATARRVTVRRVTMDSDDESGVAFQVRSKKRVSASCSCESWKGHWYEAGSASWVWEGVMAAFHGTIVASVVRHYCSVCLLGLRSDQTSPIYK
eukprot:1160956-Pelagomonas_calceolata.AAC.5